MQVWQLFGSNIIITGRCHVYILVMSLVSVELQLQLCLVYWGQNVLLWLSSTAFEDANFCVE